MGGSMTFQLMGIVLIGFALFAAPYDFAVAFAPGWHVVLQIPLGIVGIAVFVVGTTRRRQ
jgi:hypothetical protein